MNDLLIKCKEANNLVALYTDCVNLDKFHVAYILGVTDDKILEHNISPRGEFDGFSAEFIEDIYRVELNSMYISKLKQLSKQYFTKWKLNYVNGDPFQILLDLAISNKYITTLYVKSSSNPLTGYISKIEDGKVYVDMINEYGDDGKTVFYYNDIIRISTNEIYAQDLSAIRDNRG